MHPKRFLLGHAEEGGGRVEQSPERRLELMRCLLLRGAEVAVEGLDHRKLLSRKNYLQQLTNNVTVIVIRFHLEKWLHVTMKTASVNGST